MTEDTTKIVIDCSTIGRIEKREKMKEELKTFDDSKSSKRIEHSLVDASIAMASEGRARFANLSLRDWGFLEGSLGMTRLPYEPTGVYEDGFDVTDLRVINLPGPFLITARPDFDGTNGDAYLLDKDGKKLALVKLPVAR